MRLHSRWEFESTPNTFNSVLLTDLLQNRGSFKSFPLPVCSGVFVTADISVRSSQKLVIFVLNNQYLQDQSISKTISLMWKTKSLRKQSLLCTLPTLENVETVHLASRSALVTLCSSLHGCSTIFRLLDERHRESPEWFQSTADSASWLVARYESALTLCFDPWDAPWQLWELEVGSY